MLNRIASIFIILAMMFGVVVSVQAKDGENSSTSARVKNAPKTIKERVVEKIRNINPRAAVGKGKVESISGTSLTVSREGKSFTILTDSNTQFRFRFWGPNATFDDIKVGHEINVVGKWTDDARTTILASLIRDLSLQKRFGAFVGKVLTISSSGFTMSTNSESRSNQTVTVSQNTKFVNRRGEGISQSDIKVDHKVLVKGLWDKSTNTVTEVTHVKDFNLPIVNPTSKITP